MIIIISNEETSGNNNYYRAKLKEIYTTKEDIEKGNEISIDDTEYKLVGEMVSDPVTDVGDNIIDVGENIVGGVKKVWNLGKNFKHNPIGTIITIILDIVKMIGDAIQILVNTIQTSTLGTVKDFKLAYEYEYLLKDGQNNGNRDIYTNVSEFKGEKYTSYEGQKYVYVDGESKGFSKETEIPVIPIDVYNLAIGDISLLDINFFTVSEDGNENSLWLILRNIAVTIMHITFYISAAILITSLIWSGIHIVKGSIDNPQVQTNYKKRVNRFFYSIIMLVGSIVIMALSIFASNMFLEDLRSTKNELPIRVNVSFSSDDSSTEGYSFSTNFTGYVRYMAQIEDVDMYTEKALYTFEYIALVIVNAVGGGFMLLRMLVMLFLAILGPILAALYAINIENQSVLNYRTWADLYVSLAFVQIFMAIASKIVLECTIFN